ncbi:MAG: YpsA SLOG family protein [Polyangiaceae bacterium]
MRPELDAALVRDFPRLYRDRHGDTRETRMCGGFPGDGWEPLIRRLSEKLEPIARETGLRAVQVKEKFGALRCYVRGADGARKLPAAISAAVHAAIGAAVEESSRTCEHCGAAGSTRKVEGWWATLCDACLERERVRRAERKRRWREGPVAIPGAEIRVWLDDVRPAPAGWTHAKTARETIALLAAGGVVEISLDHDLGDEATCGTGYEVACWIEEAVATRGFVPPAIRIHSANVVGRERMQRAIDSIERLRAKGSAELVPAAPVVRIVSGGQTGADRGGLDAALALGIEHGGWCPAGRVAEDGQVPRGYALRETTSAEYAERTRANVRDSDGTVVFTRGAATGGSALTLRVARSIGKPVLHVDLAKLDGEAAAERVRGWCAQGSIAILNVAGSRESKTPGIGDEVRWVLLRALGALREGSPK